MSLSNAFQNASHAALYSKYRPMYPESFVNLLLDYLSRNGAGTDLAVDVGCGSGQSTFLLQSYFASCIGIDVSQAQIQEAQAKAKEERMSNVTFMVSGDSAIPVDSKTVDLVTAATSWHWFPDKTKFYDECKRVLKPEGCLAVYAYGTVRLRYKSQLHQAATALIKQFCMQTLGNYWAKEVQYIFNEYNEVVLPFSHIERHDLTMSTKASLEDFVGFLSTWSAYQKFCNLNPGNTILAELRSNIVRELTQDDACSTEEIEIEMDFPLFAVLGRN